MAGRCSRGRSGVLDVQVLARGCDPWVAEGCRHARERGGGCSVLTCVRLSVTPGTAAHQAPLSMPFSRQEYWSGLPCPPPGGLPDPGIESRSPGLQADSLSSEPPGQSWQARDVEAAQTLPPPCFRVNSTVPSLLVWYSNSTKEVTEDQRG